MLYRYNIIIISSSDCSSILTYALPSYRNLLRSKLDCDVERGRMYDRVVVGCGRVWYIVMW